MNNNREGRSRGSPAEKDGNEKTVRKEIYRLIIPMILENLLQVSAGLISTAMIGRLMASDISAREYACELRIPCGVSTKALP